MRELSLAALASMKSRELSDELERGRIIYFPQSPLPLPAPADIDFLCTELPAKLQRKNVSYYPSANRLKGIKEAATAEKTRALLEQRSKTVQSFLTRAMPELTADWTIGTSSFRPIEEKGRALSAHASNELVHIDAGAYGATHGARILRFFTNLNAKTDRVWCSKGTFAELYLRYGKDAGIDGQHSLRTPPWDIARTSALRLAAKAGWSMARMIDGSPYDRPMRRFHNFMKDSPAFQADMNGHQEFRFAPGSSWMVLTDTLSHACVSGQFALIDTFLLPLKNCRVRESAPYYVLQGLNTASAVG